MPSTIRDNRRTLPSKTTPLMQPRRIKNINSATLVRNKGPKISAKLKSPSSSAGSFSPDSLIELSTGTKEESNRAQSITSSGKRSVITSCPRTPETLICNTRITDDTTTLSSLDSIDGKAKDPNHMHYCKGNKYSNNSTEQSESDSLANTTKIESIKNRVSRPVGYRPPSKTMIQKTNSIRNELSPTAYKTRFPASAEINIQKKLAEGSNPLSANRKMDISSSFGRKEELKEQIKVNDPKCHTRMLAANLTENHQQHNDFKSKIPLSHFHDPRSLPTTANISCNKNNVMSSNMRSRNACKVAPRKSFITDIEIFMPRLTISKNNVVYKSSKIPRVTRRELCPERILMQQQLKKKEEGKSSKDIETLIKFPALKIAVTRINNNKKIVKELKENVNTVPTKTNRTVPNNKLTDPIRGQALLQKQFSTNQGKGVEPMNHANRKVTIPKRNTLQQVQKVQKSPIVAPTGKLRPSQRPRGLPLPPVCTSSRAHKVTQYRPFPARKKREKNVKMLCNLPLQPEVKSMENIKETDRCETSDFSATACSIKLAFPVRHVSRKSSSMNEWSRVQKKLKAQKTYKELYLQQMVVRDSGLTTRKDEKLVNKDTKIISDGEGIKTKSLDSQDDNVKNTGKVKQDTALTKSKKPINKNFLIYAKKSP